MANIVALIPIDGAMEAGLGHWRIDFKIFLGFHANIQYVYDPNKP